MVKITIPEGYTLIEIAERLEKKKVIDDKRVFLEYVRSKAKDELKYMFSFLSQVPTKNLEGYFFPDTYVFAMNIPYKKNEMGMSLKRSR